MNLEFVTEIIDGDTFKGDSYRPSVRLAGFDAPELNTPQGIYAKTYLENLIYGKIVTIEKVATDVYGRDIANVKLGMGSRSVNEEMKRMFGRN
ncbi:MAG: thermonuclease family protein [Candidatus Dadabacteria bacterium]|nr:thermonuclease family protein [Candidatus Dadabacteria bacterium]